MTYVLAQLNIARLASPIDSPELADFVANLDRINKMAESAPGFVWRWVTPEGDTSEAEIFGPDMQINMSVWDSLARLHEFVYRSAHVEIMRRRKEWFRHMVDAYTVMWWIPQGHLPTLAEARERLDRLRSDGPNEKAFTFKDSFPPPD